MDQSDHQSSFSSESHPTQKVDEHPADSFRSLTRLVIGGVEIGVEELLSRLALWEREIQDQVDSQPPGIQTHEATKQARLALIGLVFELQDQTRKNFSLLGRLSQAAYHLFSFILTPITSSSLITPTQRQIQRLITRGEREVTEWIETGRREDAHGRTLAKHALSETVDEYIDYLAAKPEVQDLVQTQSTGLANEVIEEVRERTISADTFLEGLARTLLRRIPRQALPAPPTAARLRTTQTHPQKRDKRSN